MAVVCAVVAVIAEPFVSVAFGPEYEPAAQILRAMIPSILALSVTTVLSMYLTALGIPRLVLAAWAIAAALAVVLGLVLVPSHEGVGAAISISAAYVALLAMVVAIGYRNRPRVIH